MNKMMNPEMVVVRFGAEDVIATSGDPVMKANYTFTTDSSTNNKNGTLTFTKGNGDPIGDLIIRYSGTGLRWSAGDWDEDEYTTFNAVTNNAVSNYNRANGVFDWFYSGVEKDVTGGFTGNAGNVLAWDGSKWTSN